MKALLYSQNYSLYTQIWSDQPPLLTVLLSIWFNLFGQSVFAARLLILLFSALLVWSFYQIIRDTLGVIPALIATLLLFTSWLFVRLSISVMIGIPSLSLAMLSIYILTIYKQHAHKVFLIGSGSLLALSLQTKLFTIFIVPLSILYLVDYKLAANNRSKLKYVFPSLIWLTSLIIVYIFVGIFCHSLNYEQLIQAHLGQNDQEKLPNFNNFEYVLFLLKQDYDYTLVALLGSLSIFLKRQRGGCLPLAWFGTTLLILLTHKPIWYHHYLLIAIPITWLAAYGVTLIINSLPNWSSFKSLNIKQLFSCLAVGIFMFSMVAIPAKPIGRPPKDPQVMELVLKYKKLTQWVFTDRPIYAFRAGLRVPPEIAVMSYKRFNSGELTTDDLFTVLKTYRPEQIILARWTEKIKSDSKFSAYVNENYLKTYENKEDSVEHYLLKELDVSS